MSRYIAVLDVNDKDVENASGMATFLSLAMRLGDIEEEDVVVYESLEDIIRDVEEMEGAFQAPNKAPNSVRDIIALAKCFDEMKTMEKPLAIRAMKDRGLHASIALDNIGIKTSLKSAHKLYEEYKC